MLMPTNNRRNLILVTIDAWRADFVATHAGVPLCPALSAIDDRTVRFDHFYANGPWTTPPLVSIFTGQSPAQHQAFYEWSAPREGGPGLAARLAQAGYAVPNLCYLNRVGGYQNLGYDPTTSPGYPRGPEDDTLIAAMREHRNRREPFFLWYHYKFVHLPYWAKEPYRRQMGIDEGAIPERLRESVCTGFVVPRQQAHLLPEDRELVQRLYAAGVLEMNDFLYRVLEELCRGDLLERTSLVLTADHGEELLDHGHVGHASTAHHAILNEEVLRVPLLIADGRVKGPRTVATRVQGMDLFSTMLSLAGVGASQSENENGDAGVGVCEGGVAPVDLSPVVLDEGSPLPAEDRVFYFHSARMGYLTPRSQEGQVIEAISDGRTKYIAEQYEVPRELRYDLVNDPEEQNPLVAQDEEMASARARLAEVRAALLGQFGSV